MQNGDRFQDCMPCHGCNYFFAARAACSENRTETKKAQQHASGLLNHKKVAMTPVLWFKPEWDPGTGGEQPMILNRKGITTSHSEG